MTNEEMDRINREYLESESCIRQRRLMECFSVVNRGSLWYETLSDTQKDELRDWYQAWLDAPETKVIPQRPSWIDGGAW